jgi:hypothetical protein
MDRAGELPASEQDALASLILREIEDDEKWDSAFAQSQETLQKLAAEALDDYKSGRTKQLRPSQIKHVWVEVDSSLVRAVAYDSETRALDVEFASGQIYSYSGVPQAIYDAFISSDTKGQFFNQVVRPTYDHKRVA